LLKKLLFFYLFEIVMTWFSDDSHQAQAWDQVKKSVSEREFGFLVELVVFLCVG